MANFNLKKLLGIPEYTSKVNAFDYLNLPFYLKVGLSNVYKDGLYGKRYDLYFPFNGGADAFEATIQRSSGTDSIHGDEEATVDFYRFTSSDRNLDPPNNYEYYSWQWLGYFKAPYTDNFTFTLNSDDYSQMWIGNLAKSGFNDSNFFISQTSGGNSISLIGGQYYPIRIQFGEYSGGDFITLSYSSSTESNVTNFQDKFFHKTKQDFIPSNIAPVKDGSSPYNAGDSAYQIKTDFPTSADGLYWIKNINVNGGTPFQIYADMTTNGGGWTLLLANHTYSTWTFTNAISTNVTTPPTDPTNLTQNYSIIGWADQLKKTSVNFQYMFDAQSRGYNGGIYTALSAYSFTEQYTGQPKGNALQNTNGWRKNISEVIRFPMLYSNQYETLTSTWDYDANGIEFRMPYYANHEIGQSYLTTNGSDGGWWGTLISDNWNPVAPWIGSYDQGGYNVAAYPTAIWYWMRDDNRLAPFTNKVISNNTSVVAQSPFGSGNAYSLDGTTQFINVNNQGDFAFTGDLTIEWFEKRTDSNPYVRPFTINEQHSIGISYEPAYGGILCWWDGQSYAGVGAIPTKNVWNHMALVRSGNTITFYVNGVATGSRSATGSFNDTSSTLYIGCEKTNALPGTYFGGLITNFRLTNGLAVYTGNFTVPTSSLTQLQAGGTNIQPITDPTLVKVLLVP